jgi:WD40 repeat protein
MPSPSHGGWIHSVAFSRDGRWGGIGSGKEAQGVEPNELRSWRASDQTQAFAATHGPKGIQSVDMSPNGRWVVACTRLTGAKVWDLSALPE